MVRSRERIFYLFSSVNFSCLSNFIAVRCRNFSKFIFLIFLSKFDSDMKIQVSDSVSFANFREKVKPKTSSFKSRLLCGGKICKLGDIERQKREQRRVLAQLYDLVPTVPDDHSTDLLLSSSSSKLPSTPEDDLSEICKLELLQRVLDYMSDLRRKLGENDENRMVIGDNTNDCSILTTFCTVRD